MSGDRPSTTPAVAPSPAPAPADARPRSVLVFPAASCQWAHIAPTDRIDGAKPSLSRAERLHAAEVLAERSPLSPSSLTMDAIVTPDHAVLICGVPRALLEAVPASVVAAHPEAVPSFLSGHQADCRAFNFLRDDLAPLSGRARSRRMVVQFTWIAALVLLAVAAGLWRRADALRSQTAQLTTYSIELLETAHTLPDTGNAPATLQDRITQSRKVLAQLQQERLGAERQAPDALGVFAQTIAAVASTSTSASTELLNIRTTTRKVDLAVSMASRDQAVSLAMSLATTLGWETTPPAEGRDNGSESGLRTYLLSAQAQTVPTRTPGAPL